ncbi:MAG: ATP-grasp fold amidoligase family protein [Pontixanthobacter sp.]
MPSLPLWLIPSARLRIGITYWWQHGRWPDLSTPTRFTEHVQRRKLTDRDPAMPLLADKVGVKRHVAHVLGAQWLIPTLWSGDTLPQTPPAPFPFILKARHGCNQNIVCRDAGDWAMAGRRAAKWVRRPYGLWLDEWAYRDLPRGYLVEPYIGTEAALPIDYKIYVFGGRATHVQIHRKRGSDHRWTLFDTVWRRVSAADGDDPAPPRHLGAMLTAAAAMARPFDFARVDFYEVADTPLFGEISFYPGSGLDPFDPVAIDTALGALWPATETREQLPWEGAPC